MNTVKFALTNKPSNSKGWARYAVAQGDRKVIQSNTGNEWVSSNKDGEAEAGSVVVIRAQVMLRSGKGRTATEEVSTETVNLIVEEGASYTLDFRPGSQGMTVVITGARKA